MSNKIIGHNTTLDLLDKLVQKDGAHHGFLFTGPEGVGKCTIARSFADVLVNDASEYGWHVHNHMDNDIHIVVPEREEKTKKGSKKIIIKDISVDQIREASRIMVLAHDKKAKVLIIDDAHRMTTGAQNALLKTLEEPRDNRYIMLITHNEGQLLQTVQSRCLQVQFNTVEAEQLHEMYESDEFVDDVNGRPGYLERMHADEDFREAVQYARTQLQSLSQKKLHERLQLATELSKKDDEYLHLFFHVWIYRIWVAAHKTKKFQLIKVADKVEQMLRVMQSTNVNKQLVLEDLLIHIV